MTALTCSKCGCMVEAAGYYCRSCRAAYMRDRRERARAERLHAVVENLSRASRETEQVEER
jgi:hypothetical protein